MTTVPWGATRLYAQMFVLANLWMPLLSAVMLTSDCVVAPAI